MFVETTTDYLSFIVYYFSTDYILLGLVMGFCTLIASFAFFKASHSHRLRSASLMVIMAVSTSIWVFFFASLAFCLGTFNQYSSGPEHAVATAASLAVLTSIALGPFAFLVLRERAVNEIYPFFSVEGDTSSLSIIHEGVDQLFQRLVSRASLSGTRLVILPVKSKFSSSAALDWHGRKVVAISESLLELLDEKELETVLSHEIGHIVQKDSIKKTIVTAYKFAFSFDPLSRLVEAALYRERELSADQYSAKVTCNPAFLASALLKIYESINASRELADSFAISSLIGERNWGILSKQPSLAQRVQRLLEMDQLNKS